MHVKRTIRPLPPVHPNTRPDVPLPDVHRAVGTGGRARPTARLIVYIVPWVPGPVAAWGVRRHVWQSGRGEGA
jgi:hypothetical protein